MSNDSFPPAIDPVRWQVPADPIGNEFTRRAPVRKFQDKLWLHILLLVLTLLTTAFAGLNFYLNYISQLGTRPVVLTYSILPQGLWYSLGVLLILGTHEMGHYLACRRYNIDASLPYFIPLPIFSGTLGAVIRIREAFPNRTVLFDIGVAGPIAGFVMVIPVLFWGLAMSEVIPRPANLHGLSFSDPLFMQGASYLVFGPIKEGQTINAHPLVFASWFGMLATAINLLPFGQLDGGHVLYAVWKRLSVPASLVTAGAVVVAAVISQSWVAMAVIMVAMLIIFGPSHPSVIYEHEPLAPGRKATAVFALVLLVICATPVPITPF